MNTTCYYLVLPFVSVALFLRSIAPSLLPFPPPPPSLCRCQDVLLVLYMANLTRAQLSLAEKLNSAVQPM